jgi:hypothetical protein
MTRDGDKEPSIGNDIEFIDWVDEEELANDYIRTWTDRERKKHTENCGEPYAYEEIFEEPDADTLRALVGGKPPMGSKRYEQEELGGNTRKASAARRSSAKEEEEDEDWEETKPAKPSRAGTRAKVEDDAEEEEDEVPARPAARRGILRSAATVGKKPVTRSKQVDEEDEEEEEPPAKPVGRRVAVKRG